MKRLTLLLCLTLALLATPAFAASQLEALKSQTASARSAVNETRSQQMSKTKELNQLSGRIEELKATAKGKLLPGSELDAALKQSQELSGVLTSLAQSLSEKESALEQSNLALLSAMTEEMRSLRADYDRQTTREGRASTIAKMKALKAEREQVRAAIPAAKVPALSNLKDSDDPTELLEQADQMRDDEDKVRSQLKALDARIGEAKAERDLDTRMRQFSGEENLFDDQDRRLRMRRETFENPPNNPAQTMGDNNIGATPQVPAAGLGPPPASHTTVGDTAGTGRSSYSAFGAPGGSSLNDKSSTTPDVGDQSNGFVRHVTQGADARPVIGKQGSGGDEDDDLNELEVQRVRLKSLADQLKARAESLQQKANQLR